LQNANENSNSDRMALIVERRPAFFKAFQEQVLQRVDPNSLCPLSADHLLSLIYYNVHRALIANLNMLGLDLHLMHTDDYPSPFLTQRLDSPYVAALPSNFRPTYLQATIPHHPQWDIFPDPVIRNNVLLYGEENIDDIELCLDLLGDDSFTTPHEDPQSRTGMIVWGEPWDIMSWEVTEKFAKKYSWFLIGADVLLMSTNEWRRRRGERPLAFA
jgi:Domain of unknown function (DUF3425)